MMNTSPVPLPPINADTRVFWEAAERNVLAVLRCAVCGGLHLSWRDGCPVCGSDLSEWIECSGDGTLHSFVRLHAPGGLRPHAGVIAVVALAEGLKIMCGPLDARSSQVGGESVGASVRVEFARSGNSLEMLGFRVVGMEDGGERENGKAHENGRD